MNPSSLLVHITAGANNDALLAFTSDLARQLGVRRVIGISACQPLKLLDGPDMYVPQDLIDQDSEEIELQFERAESRFREMLSPAAVALEWRSTLTSNLLADYIARQSRAADLVVANPPAGGFLFGTARRVGIADLVLRAGRPVLVVNSTIERLDLGNALVAWKDCREARRAAEDALPLLKIAGRTTVVEISPESERADAEARTDDVVRWLKGHGIAATSQVVASAGDDAGQLDAIAQTIGAGLIVGGAYGHNRVREWVLGGVTRDMLLAPARCSFVSH
jgi:nucleotide-binding universal stress UspA family protein